MFEKIMRFFRLQLYTRAQIAQFVAKGIITAEQYEMITGDKYEE